MKGQDMTQFRIFTRLLPVVFLAGILAGCVAEIEKEVGECEPGVSDISGIDAAVPQCP